MLAEDELCHSAVTCLGVVDLIAVDEHDDVTVLLNRTRLTKVTIEWALIGSLFYRTVELRQRDNRAIELLGQRFQRRGDTCDLKVAIFLTIQPHQLEVVDH